MNWTRRFLATGPAQTLARPGVKYGLRFTVSLIPGDGIGRELCESVQTVFAAARVPVDFEEVQLSGYGSDPHDLQRTIASLRRNRIGLKGIIYTPLTGNQTSFNVAIRRALDIYASVVQIHTLPGCRSRHPNIDMVIIRENTEGEYSGLEHEPVPGVVESLKVTTRANSQRIVQFAFDYARQNGRRKVTCVHKANIMKLTDGLFLRVFREVADANKHTGIECDSMIVDNTAMQMVSNPAQFDVIVTPNLYGNIVSNIGAGLIGSAGLIPGYNIGRDYAIFEPVRRARAAETQSARARDTSRATLRAATWRTPSRCCSAPSLCSATSGCTSTPRASTAPSWRQCPRARSVRPAARSPLIP